MTRMGMLAGAIAVLLTGGLAANAAPASSYASDQVNLRIVADAPGPGGTVRGAVLVDIAPGWHTYWLDPGASGIPPRIDFSGTQGLDATDLAFPAPLRFGEGLARANGYDRPLAIPFELSPQPGVSLDTVAASLAIGVCHEICIPVQAELATRAGAADVAQIVDAAFAALPAADGHLGRIRSATLPDGGDMLTVVVETALDAPSTDLFVLGPQGWYFDEPAPPVRNGDSLEFSVPVAGRPRGETGGPDAVEMVVTGAAGSFAAEAVPVASGQPG
ncbi:protein-disulfide reductase DsbD domain-containing protein [Aurantimonas sp. A2-1-M11]|uniref:protein-disulfide reductase DsbD domain-containing protein n=1 Tax=Aurantimonas sp. A2-1-M11 TaxID=3113712 RepID=UPI002F942069